MYSMSRMSRLTNLLCATGAALLCLLPFAAGAQSPTRTKIIVSGSSTISPLISDIARRFESVNPGTAIEVRAHGSGKGVAELRDEVSDIAMVSRLLASNERDLFAYPICRDGAAVVVHATNPVKGLSSRQLSDVLTGAITDWKQLGGRPGPIRLAWRTEGQVIPELILQHLKLKSGEVRSQATFSETAEALKFVAGRRDAVTVTALAAAERAVKRGVPVRLLAYDGVPASTRAIKDRTYALSRPLLLVARTVPTGVQKRFVDFAVSDAVTDLQEKHGFVPY